MYVLIVILSILTLPLLSHGATYYVSNGGTNNSCAAATNPSTRRSTINNGIACLSAGDTLVIANGTYNERIDDNIPSGSSGAPTIIRAENNRQATMQPSGSSTPIIWISHNAARSYITVDGLVLDGVNTSPPIFLFQVQNGSSSNISILNMEIKNAPNYNACSSGNNTVGIGLPSGTNFLIKNNWIHNIGLDDANEPPGACSGGDHYFYSYCIYGPLESSTVEDNDLGPCSSYGYHAYPSGANVTFRNNYVHDNGGPVLFTEPEGNLLYNNVIVNNDGARAGGNGGIELGGLSGAINIYNNTIYNNGGPCISLGGVGTGGNVKNNICYANGNDAVVNSAGNTISTNLFSNPSFVSVGDNDYRITSSSTARDAGATIGTVTTDKNGVTRPQGSAYDIGAYEFGDVAGPTATRLVFSTEPQTVGSGVTMNTLVVRAVDNTGAIDTSYTTNIVLTLLRTVPTTGLTAVADSQETVDQNNVASNAIDGNYNTIWHTQYTGGSPGHNHTLTIDMQSSNAVDGVRYMPRGFGNSNGALGQYDVLTSSDCSAFTSRTTGTVTNFPNPNTFSFTSLSTRCVRLTFVSELNGNPWSSASEVSIKLTTGGTLSGTATVAATSGESQFPGLSVTPAGRYVLMATSGTLNSFDSQPFLVTSPAEPPPIVIVKGAPSR